jgi:myosin-crossreactive antigen
MRSLSINNIDHYTPKYENIIIIGGGIAGLSTARYLLANDKNIHITIIDKNTEIPNQAPYSTYDKQQVDLLHYNIPSRRNGNVLCPSLTVPWTTRSLWNEAFLPLMKSYFGSNEKGDRPANITFDVPSLLLDGNMVRFITVNAMTVFFF